MALVVNTNLLSLNAQRNLNNTSGMLSTALQRLSSGLRVNSARDDAAGLAISTRFTAQINGLNQGARNAADGISLAQTGEGALGEMTTLTQRIRELAVQSANGTNTAADRTSLDAEVTELGLEITRLSGTQFNGVDIIGGDAGVFNFQVGANTTDVVAITTTDITAATNYAAVSSTGGVDTSANATAMITATDGFLTSISSARGTFGAAQSRFESIIRNVSNNAENLSAARSRILDTDFAAETAALTKAQILQQAGIAMLSQANSSPQSVLSLLQ